MEIENNNRAIASIQLLVSFSSTTGSNLREITFTPWELSFLVSCLVTKVWETTVNAIRLRWVFNCQSVRCANPVLLNMVLTPMLDRRNGNSRAGSNLVSIVSRKRKQPFDTPSLEIKRQRLWAGARNTFNSIVESFESLFDFSPGKRLVFRYTLRVYCCLRFEHAIYS